MLDDQVLAELRSLADQAQAVVPNLVGVSIACSLRGSPSRWCETGEIAVLDEEQWHRFALATAAHAIRSTLTLPV